MVKKISEYGGMEKYSSKKAMGKHEGKESSRAEAGEKSMAMKKRGGGMATRGMGVALKKGGKVMKKAMGGDVNPNTRNPPALGLGKPIGRVDTVKPKFSGRPLGEVTNKPPKIGGFTNGIDNRGRGVYDAAPPNVTRMKKAMGGGVSSPIGRPNTAKPMPSNPLNRGPISNLPARVNPTAPRQSNPMDRGAVSRMKKGGMAKGRKGCK